MPAEIHIALKTAFSEPSDADARQGHDGKAAFTPQTKISFTTRDGRPSVSFWALPP